MKCPGCNKNYENDENKCLSCGKDLVLDQIDFELPLLKENNIEDEETKAISTIDKDDDSFSLLDDINKQIDSVNQEADHVSDNNEKEDISSVVQQEELFDEPINVLSTDESIKSRKSIFKITGIIFLSLIILLTISYFLFFKEDNTKKKDYVLEVKESLDNYYEYDEIENLLEILNEIKNKEEVLYKVQEETLVKCDEWVSLYLKENIKNKKQFSEVTQKYKNLIVGIYKDVVIFYKNDYVRLLNKNEYDNLINQIDDIYKDGLIYYEALDLYNKKDYNKSYHSFNKVEEDNHFYSEAINYEVKIIEDILSLMNKDIEKLEMNLSNFSDEEKLLKYTQIENIIYEYGNVYVDVKLNDNQEYVSILDEYKNKVNEYTNIIFNGEDIY